MSNDNGTWSLRGSQRSGGTAGMIIEDGHFGDHRGPGWHNNDNSGRSLEKSQKSGYISNDDGGLLLRLTKFRGGNSR